MRWARVIRKFRSQRSSQIEAIEVEKARTLEHAERDLADLQHRASLAVGALEARGGRNHWRESVERMIQGVI